MHGLLPLKFNWNLTDKTTEDTQENDGAALPEYGWNRSQAKDNSIILEGSFVLPPETINKRLFLRFDRVGCYTKVLINGNDAGMHIGSHTVWECPLNEYITKTDNKVRITLEMNSGESVFSPYQTPGIHGGISLLILPQTYISKLIVRTSGKSLSLEYALGGEIRPDNNLTAELFSPEGERLKYVELDPKAECVDIENLDVWLWDAEHPNLYRLVLTLNKNGDESEIIEKKIGFTEIKMEDPKIILNGKPLKLRGINYREPLPKENCDIKADLMLFKHANINFLRSMYYPYSEELLCMCDELGFYVEQCAPFQEIDNGIASTQNTPGNALGFTGQFAEILRDGISHSSIVSWSLGSDCSWGSNFRNCYRLAKELDPKRPCSFFLPMTVPEEEPELDIWNVAFVDWRQQMDTRYDQMVIFHTQGADNEIGYAVGSAPESNKPVLHSVFAPPAVFNRNEIEKDYGIREFWGQSIKQFWDKMWDTEGCLGGAILAAVDENGDFSPRLKDFNWGILDTNHRPKPEYHHVRMAYAPVIVEHCARSESGIVITVRNRFCHTDLSELTCTWNSSDKSGEKILSGQPGETASFNLDGSLCYSEISLLFRNDGFCHFIVLPVEKTKPEDKGIDGGQYVLHTQDALITAKNSKYSFTFNKDTGQLTQGLADGNTLLVGGPYLQTTRLTLGTWKGRVSGVSMDDDSPKIMLTGSYGDVCRVCFTLTIGTDGTLGTKADILTLNKPMPHSVKAGVGIDPGGLNEWGIAWDAAHGSESLYWQRKGLWSWYPEKHIGRNEGEACIEDANDFTSTKHHIDFAALKYSTAGIVIPCDGDDLSLRLEKQDDAAFIVSDRDSSLTYTGLWHEMNDYFGDYNGTESLSDEVGATVKLNFAGTGIRVYGAKDFLFGEGEATLDGGELISFDQYIDKVDLPGASRGYEKRYNQLLFEADNLQDGEHSLKITVSGRSQAGAQGRYVSISKFVVLSPNAKPPLRLILNRDFNYTRLVRGNVMRPRVEFSAGDSVSTTIRLYSGIENMNTKGI